MGGCSALDSMGDSVNVFACYSRHHPFRRTARSSSADHRTRASTRRASTPMVGRQKHAAARICRP
eukprot:15463106-Alexandrium_andersonii.AAC.1